MSHTDTYKATKEEKLEAERALAKYDLLTDNDERGRWIKQFEQNGGGIGPNALKFASKFDKSLEFNDSTTLRQVEDYYSPGEILQFNGTCIANFKSVTEAVEDAEYLVKKNMEAHGWTEEEHPPLLDEVKPEYSKYWFARGMGKETSWERKQQKSLRVVLALRMSVSCRRPWASWNAWATNMKRMPPQVLRLKM